jgi:hypothetical protein
MLEGGTRKRYMIGHTFGLGRRLLFLRYFLLAATATTTTTIFFVSIRAVVFVFFIWSTLVTLSKT